METTPCHTHNNQTSKRNTIIIIITTVCRHLHPVFWRRAARRAHVLSTGVVLSRFTLPNTRHRDFSFHRSFPLRWCSSNFTALHTTVNGNNYTYIYNLTYICVNGRTECRREGEGKDPSPIFQQPYTCDYIVVNVYIRGTGPITD